MDVNYVNERNLNNYKFDINIPIKVLAVSKKEERMCYDAYWWVLTSVGPVLIKTYDGHSEKDMLTMCQRCRTINEILELQPKCFYYD